MLVFLNILVSCSWVPRKGPKKNNPIIIYHLHCQWRLYSSIGTQRFNVTASIVFFENSRHGKESYPSWHVSIHKNLLSSIFWARKQSFWETTTDSTVDSYRSERGRNKTVLFFPWWKKSRLFLWVDSVLKLLYNTILCGSWKSSQKSSKTAVNMGNCSDMAWQWMRKC